MSSIEEMRLEVIRGLCESVNTPRSLSVFMLYQYGEHKQIAELAFDPSGYRYDCFHSDLEKLRNDYLVSSFLSKSRFLSIDTDLSSVAMTKLFEYEQKCRETNQRFRKARVEGFPPHVNSILFAASRKISNLHERCKFSLASIYEQAQFGPGATRALSRRESYVHNKVLDLSISPSALKYLNLDLETSRLFNDIVYLSTNDPKINYVEGNRVTTVPKDATTDRTIAIENSYNMLYQKGYGNFLRDALRSVGVTLDDQSRNQKLARDASTCSLATVDLKGASASISVELVWDLLPYDVCSILDDLRSKSFEHSGIRYRYEQFSSMGNGFTFELESLIFWAISQSVIDAVSPADRRLAVYGDDIIISSECLPLLFDVFDFIGFTANKKKTHSQFGFRESCGKHYFHGYDVSPIFWKRDIDVLENAYRLANSIRRLAFDRCAGTGSDGVLYHAWTAAVAVVRYHEDSLRMSFEVPLNSELDGGLALPLSEMKGYAFLRLKHGDTIVRRTEYHKYNPALRSTRYYIWSERRREVLRGFQSYVSVLRNNLYRPFSSTEASRSQGRYGPSTVRVYETVVNDAGWLGT